MTTIKRIKLVGADKKETGEWFVINNVTGEIIIKDITESHAKGVAHGYNHNHKFGGTNSENIFFALSNKTAGCVVHTHLVDLCNKEHKLFDEAEHNSAKEIHADNVNAIQRILRIVRHENANGK